MRPFVVAARHLLVDDAAAGGHPLDVARTDDPLVAHAVAVLHPALQDVGDRLDAPVRVPREPGQVVRRVVGVEVVEQQERVEQGDLVIAEGPLQMHAGPLDGRLALPDFADLAHGFHIIPPMMKPRINISRKARRERKGNLTAIGLSTFTQ